MYVIKFPKINDKYITTTKYHRENFKSYIDSYWKRIGYWIVGIFGICSSVASIIFYLLTAEWQSFIFLIFYFLILGVIISIERASKMHRWNLKNYMIIFFLVALGIQIVAIILYIFHPMSIIEFIFLTLGTSWAPACVTIWSLYCTRERVNLIGRIHLLLWWIYLFNGVKKESSYSTIRMNHLYFHNYMSELNDLLIHKVKLKITNIPEILTSFYTKVLENKDHLKSIIIDQKDQQIFTKVFADLYKIRMKDVYKKSSNDFIDQLIKITKVIAVIDTIKLTYITIIMKIKQALRKSAKYLVPTITSVSSLVLKLMF